MDRYDDLGRSKASTREPKEEADTWGKSSWGNEFSSKDTKTSASAVKDGGSSFFDDNLMTSKPKDEFR